MKNILMYCLSFVSVVSAFSQKKTIDQKKGMDEIRKDPFNQALYEKVDLVSVVKTTTLEISLLKNNSMLLFIRSYAKANLGDVYGAISDLDKVVKLTEGKTDKLLVESYMLRGNYLYAIGEKQKGCLDWSRVGEIKPNDTLYTIIRQFCKVEVAISPQEEEN
jgi:hypothetical protein